MLIQDTNSGGNSLVMQPFEDVITKQGGNENVPNSINYQTQYQIITDQLPLKAPLENDASFHQE